MSVASFTSGSSRKLFFINLAMVKLSTYARNRVISLSTANISTVYIVKILKEEDGIKTSRTNVSSFIARYRQTGILMMLNGVNESRFFLKTSILLTRK